LGDGNIHTKRQLEILLYNLQISSHI